MQVSVWSFFFSEEKTAHNKHHIADSRDIIAEYCFIGNSCLRVITGLFSNAKIISNMEP